MAARSQPDGFSANSKRHIYGTPSFIFGDGRTLNTDYGRCSRRQGRYRCPWSIGTANGQIRYVMICCRSDVGVF